MDIKIRTGLVLTALSDGLVSAYEEREAARFALLTWPEYERLDRAQRIQIVAHYRTQQLIEFHTQDAVQRYSRRHA